VGYFKDLEPTSIAALHQLLLEIGSAPSSFFSLRDNSFVGFNFVVDTGEVTLSSNRDDAAELGHLIEALGKQWREASVTILHGTKTPNLGLKHAGAYRNEQFSATFDNFEGMCQLKALFREAYDTRGYILRAAGALALAEKPIKSSRYIPEWLETKLLCDSMHLCNICRENGVIIHHIVPIEDGGPTKEENLIVLCLNHHNGAHSKSNLSKGLKPEHLGEYKRRHMLWVASKGSGMALAEDTELEKE
jgi:hypothetical protein